MRVLFCALVVLGAVAGVYRLRHPRFEVAPTPTVQNHAEAPPPPIAALAAPHAATVAIAPPATDAYRGLVLDGETGKPLENVQVMLCRGVKDGHPACADSIASGDTDERGQFEIERPDEPVGALVVDVDDYAVAVISSPAALSRIELWSQAVVTGHVVDGNGNPVYARVGWMLPGAQLRLDTHSESESDGSFRTGRLPAGELILYAMSEDHHTAIARLWLSRGEHRDLVLTLDDAEPLHVRGVVQDRTGRPLAFVQVAIEPRHDLAVPDADALLAAHQRRYMGTTIDGEFEIDFHTPGPHRLSFWGWDRDTGDLLAEAEVRASEDPPVIQIPVWDPNIVVCHLEGENGRTEPFSGYQFRYSLQGETTFGAMASGGSQNYELAFVWPHQASLIGISLAGETVAGTVELRLPSDRCTPRGSR
jgi:hypothetical protein